LGRRLTWRSTAQTAARELKEAHESLVEAQSRMGEFSARLQQAEQLSTLAILTSGLAHEIRNPTNGITNAIEPLRELLPKEVVGPETGPGQLLGVMSECAEQLSFLSSQLLGFKRDQALAVSPTDLTQLLQRAIRLAHRALTGVEVGTEFGVDQLVSCSGPLLVQAIMNLIENAGHAVGPGGWVQITTKMVGSSVHIEVTDSGAGVPVALRERIFEPFFTTKGAGVGTGLGLPVSRAIVQRHGGVLEIRECNGRPAFVIELPISESTLAVAQAVV
jgi:signal transduction histidine kinase